MRKTAALPMLAMVALLAACQKEAPKADSAKVTQAAAPASRGKFDPTTHTATIYAKDFAFETPDTISAGLTNFHLVNEGPNLHHVQIVRLDSGKTANDLGAAMKNPGPPPAWAVFVGGPNAPDAGSQSDATFDVAPGNYAVLCLIDIPDKTPHFAKGMLKALTVVPASGPAMAAPNADVTITLADYNFTIKGPLTAGKHTIRVDNAGPQLHEIEIIRLADGKTMKDLGAWMKTMQGPPPANAIGGVVALVPKTGGFVTVDLKPGNYVAICFLPDAKDGKAHMEHGMTKEFKVN